MENEGIICGERSVLRYKKLGCIRGAQDGAIFGGRIFRLDARGICRIYDLERLEELTSFKLDKTEVFCPHSNAVCFGTEYYAPGDAYPLLYSNAYNNYSSKPERMEGTCGVYRITEQADGWHGELVQLIRIGFVSDTLWKSANVADVRPYGNLVVDTDTGSLYAFTMRDEDRVTRYFRFALPKAADGVYDEAFGVRVVTLGKADIRDSFDCPYSIYLQGACCCGGKLYSTEGFSDDDHPAVIQVIDLAGRKRFDSYNLRRVGLDIEPEFVSAWEDKVYYSDAHGAFFLISIEEKQ